MRLKKKDLPALKAEIKRLAAEGRAYHPRIQAVRGPERHRLRGEKDSVGWRARTLLLAYAFLREVPYRVLEPRCLEDSVPYLRRTLVHRAAIDVGEWAPEGRDGTEGSVEAWFDAGLPDEKEVAA